MDYRTGLRIVTVKPHNPNVRELNAIRPGLRLRVMNENHVARDGSRCLLVQKETADHPMHGLFSIKAEVVQ